MLPLGDEFLNLILEIVGALLGFDLLPHAKVDRGLIDSLIGSEGHPVLVPNSHQEQPPLRAVDGHLPDDLIECLRVELLANRADSLGFGLPVLEHLVEPVLQLDYVLPGGGLVRYVLDVELFHVVDPVARGDDGIENLLGLGRGLVAAGLL